MKYYETTFDEYILSSHKHNIHSELDIVHNNLSENINEFHNIILQGPSGSGKYTQALKIIQKYSPSKLKYDRKISISNEKVEKKKTSDAIKKKTSVQKKEPSISKRPEFTYRISDIHYEVDMSLLGCNSKTLWHDIYFQIIDIISVKQNKFGIILCKNFDSTYNELLDIFYSYIKHPLETLNIRIYFILLTQSISFIPNNILNSSQIIPIKRPSKEDYVNVIETQGKSFFYQKKEEKWDIDKILNTVDIGTVNNIKELYIFNKIENVDEIPHDIEYTICDKILEQITRPEKIILLEFRNLIYDMLVYTVNIPESIYYIISECIYRGYLHDESVSDVLQYSFTFLKYYNNNYRSIYHLESIIFFIINKIHFK